MYGQSLSSTLPTVGVTTGPTYATRINAFLQELQDIVEAKVTPAGIDISSDLSCMSGGVSYRVKDLLGTSYTNQTSALSATTYPTKLYFAGADGDIYANDAAGNQIQLTSSGAVNTATVSGITGTGYGSSGVEVNWDSGSSAYLMKAGAGSDAYADVEMDDLKLNDGSGNFLTIATPSLAANYTITLPAAAPASQQILQMTSGGTVTASNTVAQSITMASNQNITLAGTGDYKHGGRVLILGAMMFHPAGDIDGVYTAQASSFVTYKGGWNATADASFICAIPLCEGDQITGFTVHLENGVSVSSRTATMKYTQYSSFAIADNGTGSTNTAGSNVTIAVTGLTGGMTSASMPWLLVTIRSGDTLISAHVNYNRP